MFMDEKMARKVGEIKAFCVLGAELWVKGKEALSPVFGETIVLETVEKLNAHATKIDEVMANTEWESAMNEKVEKTKAKVGGMAETYIGDAWDDATELCEWLGFFEGAAVVHFSLVLGKAERSGNTELLELSKEGMELHQNLLQKVTDVIRGL
jgi:hypothetical protein